MPSPLIHTAAGYLIWHSARASFREYRYALAFGFLSLLPDLDALPGLYYGDLHSYHNHFSHSLFAGVAAALLVGTAARLLGSRSSRTWTIYALACYWTHLFMDYLTVGRGVKLFWPVSPDRFFSPLKVFYGLRWSEGLWSVHHLYTLSTEVLFIAAVALLSQKAVRISGRASP